MTVSAGLAAATSSDQSVEEIIARADEALCRAKRSGGNRVTTGALVKAA